MKKLTKEQKMQNNGGSFYAVALGIGILVSTLSTLVMNIVTTAKAAKMTNNSANINELFGNSRRSVMMRLSPVPSRSSVMVM